jgi:hypothetical protein
MDAPIYEAVMKARKDQQHAAMLLERDRCMKIVAKYEKKAKIVAQIRKEIAEGK